MKKAYMAPNAKAITLSFEGMIADSLNSTTLDGTENGGNTSTNGVYEGDSRRRSIWEESKW